MKNILIIEIKTRQNYTKSVLEIKIYSQTVAKTVYGGLMFI